MAHKTKESREKKEKNPPAMSTPSYPTREATSFPTKPRIPASIPGLDAKGVSPELLPSRLNSLLLLYLVIFSLLLTLSPLFS
jgi:hypothetical protein